MHDPVSEIILNILKVRAPVESRKSVWLRGGSYGRQGHREIVAIAHFIGLPELLEYKIHFEGRIRVCEVIKSSVLAHSRDISRDFWRP